MVTAQNRLEDFSQPVCSAKHKKKDKNFKKLVNINYRIPLLEFLKQTEFGLCLLTEFCLYFLSGLRPGLILLSGFCHDVSNVVR